MYYIIRYDEEGHNAAGILDKPDVISVNNFVFDLGKKMDMGIPRAEFSINASQNGELLDYVLTSLRGMVVSEKFKNVLDESGADNIDYYPVVINNNITKRKFDGYYIANIVGLVDCMDMDNSKYQNMAAFPDKIRVIENLKIDEDKIKGLVIFRLMQRSSIILINGYMRNILAKEHLSGVKIVQADGYSTI